MPSHYGKHNTYGGGKSATGLPQNSYGNKTSVGYNPSSYKGTGRRAEKWIADPRGK